MTMSEEEEKRRKHTKHVLANLGLEGIQPSEELRADMELRDLGKLSQEDFLARALARAKDQPLPDLTQDNTHHE